MRIIKPTLPPSMSVIVDPIMSDSVILTLMGSHPVKSRIDSIFVKDGKIGILPGTECNGPPLYSVPGAEMRILARITIPPMKDYITENDITELNG